MSSLPLRGAPPKRGVRRWELDARPEPMNTAGPGEGGDRHARADFSPCEKAWPGHGSRFGANDRADRHRDGHPWGSGARPSPRLHHRESRAGSAATRRRRAIRVRLDILRQTSIRMLGPHAPGESRQCNTRQKMPCADQRPPTGTTGTLTERGGTRAYEVGLRKVHLQRVMGYVAQSFDWTSFQRGSVGPVLECVVRQAPLVGGCGRRVRQRSSSPPRTRRERAK